MEIKQGWWIFVAILAAQSLALLPPWNSLFCVLLMGECAQPCSVEGRGARSILAPSSQGTGSDPG